MLKDQYGYDVPGDLVLIHWDYVTYGGPGMIDVIDQATWYEADGHLLVSLQELETYAPLECDYYEPVDVGIDIWTAKIFLVAYALHRWDTASGFYHA